MTEGSAKSYADFYDEAWYRIASHQGSPQQTEMELKFIVQTLALTPGARLLDLGCGYGRLAVPLALAGYAITGLDLAPSLLRRAGRTACEAGVKVRCVRRDMRDIPFESCFEAVVCWGVFGALESDQEDLKVLLAVQRALVPGGHLLLSLMNREFYIRHEIPSYRVDLPGGAASEKTMELDLLEGCRRGHEALIEKDGSRREYAINRQRLYSLKELADMLRAAGLAMRGVWGDCTGSDYGLDSLQMIVLAEKEDTP
jgi:SAM-dependent methyltransferase